MRPPRLARLLGEFCDARARGQNATITAVHRKARPRLMRHRSPALILLLLGASPALAAPPDEVAGVARTVDGDTLRLSGIRERIRLFGIDAPEHNQSCERNGAAWDCGSWSSRLLASLIDGRTVRCTVQDTDRFGRLVAICFEGETELNAAMVRAGAAVAFRRFSARYVADEEAARAAGIGLWSGRFEVPADFRAKHREMAR